MIFNFFELMVEYKLDWVENNFRTVHLTLRLSYEEE